MPSPVIEPNLEKHIACIAESLGLEGTRQAIRQWNDNLQSTERHRIEEVAGKVFPKQPTQRCWEDWHRSDYRCDSSDSVPAGLVGILHTVFFRTGGTETWARHFIRLISRTLRVAGLAYLGGDEADVMFSQTPTGRILGKRGLQAAKNLASICDSLILWGICPPVLDELRSHMRPGCNIIHVHHGDTSSTWSEQLVRSARLPNEALVCVHPLVARKLSGSWIANAVDMQRTARNRCDASDPTVLFMHRFSVEKQPLLAIDAVRALPTHWKAIFAGRGELWEQSILRANGDPRIRFLPDANPIDVFPQSHVFLSLSNSEGFGYSTAEAAASGLRVVSLPVGICENRRVCRQLRADELAPAEIAEQILLAYEERQEALLAGQWVTRKYSEEVFYHRWVELLGGTSAARTSKGPSVND
jgi:glycosyltransferase involved in cell wall biosynthesis